MQTGKLIKFDGASGIIENFLGERFWFATSIDGACLAVGQTLVFEAIDAEAINVENASASFARHADTVHFECLAIIKASKENTTEIDLIKVA